MDSSRRAVESYWRSKMLDGATSDEDKVTPVYKLEDICELLRSSHVVDIGRDYLEADTSSYHCNVIRQISLDVIDPSLAIGFYCRDKDDFDNFCSRASDLAAQSNGAPLLTVTQSRNPTKPASHYETSCDSVIVHDDDPFAAVGTADADNSTQEDEWQIL